MAKRKRPAQPEARRAKNLPAGRRAHQGQGDSQETLVSLQLGALPIINRVIQRMRLHEFLTRHFRDNAIHSRSDHAIRRELGDRWQTTRSGRLW